MNVQKETKSVRSWT